MKNLRFIKLHTKLFTKIIISQNFADNFAFCKNELIVHRLSFETKAIVIVAKRYLRPLYPYVPVVFNYYNIIICNLSIQLKYI